MVGNLDYLVVFQIDIHAGGAIFLCGIGNQLASSHEEESVYIGSAITGDVVFMYVPGNVKVLIVIGG